MSLPLRDQLINEDCVQKLKRARDHAKNALDRCGVSKSILAVDAATFLIHGLDEVFEIRQENQFPPVDRPLKNQIRKTTQTLAGISKYLLPAYAQKREEVSRDD